MFCLVTGATGFVGSHICHELIARNHQVRAFIRPHSNLLALNGLDIEQCLGDIMDPDTLLPAMDGIDWVFHTAARPIHWQDDPLLVPTIVEGSKNVLNAALAASVQRFIYTSSAAALGIPEQGQIVTENDQYELAFDQWPYGFAKRTAENEVKLAVEAGLDCVIVNPTTVFGPRDLNAVAGTLIIQIAQNQIPFLTKGGMNVVHVKDVAVSHLAAAELGRCGQRYIIGGQNLPNSDLIKIIAAECQVAAPKMLMPSWLIKLGARGFEFLSPFVSLSYNGNFLRLSTYNFYYDTSKSHRELHLPTPSPITQAISEAVSWYKANDYI